MLDSYSLSTPEILVFHELLEVVLHMTQETLSSLYKWIFKTFWLDYLWWEYYKKRLFCFLKSYFSTSVLKVGKDTKDEHYRFIKTGFENRFSGSTFSDYFSQFPLQCHESSLHSLYKRHLCIQWWMLYANILGVIFIYVYKWYWPTFFLILYFPVLVLKLTSEFFHIFLYSRLAYVGQKWSVLYLVDLP